MSATGHTAGVLAERERLGGLLLLKIRQDRLELCFEPGMQHSVGRRQHALGPQFAGRRAKEREQFGCSCTGYFAHPFVNPVYKGVRAAFCLFSKGSV